MNLDGAAVAEASKDQKLKPDWRVVRFDEIAENITDRVDDPSQAGVDRYVGLEHLDPESLKISRWGVPTDVEATKLRFEPGDIIFGKRRAYQRKLAVADFEGICSAHAMVLRAKPGVIVPEFLPFFMQSDVFFETALAISVGSLSPTINWSTLSQQLFAVPPTTEQLRIAALLAASTEVLEKQAAVANAVAAARGVLLDEIIPAPIHGRDTNAVPLSALCTMQNGRPFPSAEYQQTGIRLLRPGNLGANGRFDWNPLATTYLPGEYRDAASDYLIAPGDVVINLTAQSLEDGFMGRVCLASVEDESLLNQRIGRFRCDERLVPDFLFRCLQTSRFRRVVETKCEGSKIRHLYWRHFEDFEIVLSSLQDQATIAARAGVVDAALSKAAETAQKAAHVHKTIRETLLRSSRAENVQ